MFKANIIFLLGILKKKVAVCQDYVLSPILANIYFHELDLLVKKNIVERYKKGIKPMACPSYQRSVSFVYSEKKAVLKQRQKIVSKNRKEVWQIDCLRTVATKYIRVNYLRYLDDVLMGVRGPKVLAEKIFKTLTFFFKSNLRLSLNKKKSHILNSFSSKISFLGTLIYNVSIRKFSYVKSRKVENKKLKSLRVLSRLKVLKDKEAKFFKDKCLAFLRKSYNRHGNSRAIVQKDFLSLVENSAVFNNGLNKSNRFIYREFLKDLQ